MRNRRPDPPSKRLLAATNAFYAAASPREVEVPEVPKARAKAVPWEHIEQCKVVRWWDKHCEQMGLPDIALMAVPNSGKRSKALGAWMQAEGLRAGAPDLILLVRRYADMKDYGFLAVEMKRTDGGVQSSEQQKYEEYLRSGGYRYQLCNGAVHAVHQILNYLGYPCTEHEAQISLERR